jgi:hypothetical protein
LQKSSISISEIKEKGDHFTISLYSGELTEDCIVKNILKIREAFPTLTEGFYNILTEELTESKFSNERLVDAVKHVIRNCVYPKPTIAQFLNFDKSIELYDFYQVSSMKEFGKDAFKIFRPIDIDGLVKPMYAKESDIVKYNLPRSQPKERE